MKALLTEKLKALMPSITETQLTEVITAAEAELTNQVGLKENELRKSLNIDAIVNEKKAFEAISRKAIKDLAELSYSNSEVEAKDFKELVSEAKTAISAKTEAASKATDETLKNSLVTITNEKKELEIKLNQTQEDWTKKLTDKEADFTNKLRAKDINIWVEKKVADPKIKLRDPDFNDIVRDKVMSKLLNDYVEDEAGNLKAKDGTHATLEVEGKPVIVATKDDLYSHIAKKYMAVDNPGGGGGSGVPINPNNPASPPVDPRVAAMIADNAAIAAR